MDWYELTHCAKQMGYTPDGVKAILCAHSRKAQKKATPMTVLERLKEHERYCNTQFNQIKACLRALASDEIIVVKKSEE